MAREVTPEQIEMLDAMVARARKAARPVWTACARLSPPPWWT